MHKRFEINRTNIKGGCQSGRKVATHNSKSDVTLEVWSLLAIWGADVMNPIYVVSMYYYILVST